MDLLAYNVHGHHSANCRYQSTQQNKNIIKRSILINSICIVIVGLNQVKGGRLAPILAITGVDRSTHE